ncbi:MAG: ribonuclease III [Gammaproteobacteria bacterium]|nr:MAG: ribonuclease III [Gammaproteobacteria bacterium]TDJ33901.1 MAG: ribonuclease III [Gammaproteobacteria bacterium]
MNNFVSLTALEDRLGHHFNNKDLLLQALTHKSRGKENNERLEFLGDAVLGYVVADLLFYRRQEAAEDTLTLMRSSLVKGETLADVAKGLGLGDYLRLGVGEQKSGGHRRSSILADTLEAIIGAVHIDAGVAASTALVIRLLGARLENIDAQQIKDPKTLLQEYLQARSFPLPEYTVIATGGFEHEKVFKVSCRVTPLQLEATAEGSSRRAAEKLAAAEMLTKVPQDG